MLTALRARSASSTVRRDRPPRPRLRSTWAVIASSSSSSRAARAEVVVAMGLVDVLGEIADALFERRTSRRCIDDDVSHHRGPRTRLCEYRPTPGCRSLTVSPGNRSRCWSFGSTGGGFAFGRRRRIGRRRPAMALLELCSAAAETSVISADWQVVVVAILHVDDELVDLLLRWPVTAVGYLYKNAEHSHDERKETRSGPGGLRRIAASSPVRMRTARLQWLPPPGLHLLAPVHL
jgi:hypothetical protein